MLDINKDDTIEEFREKDAITDGSRINGGYMVMEPEVFDYLEDDNTVFEKYPLERLAQEGNLKAYRHDGYWQCMDTKREKDRLDELWSNGKAPWKVW